MYKSVTCAVCGKSFPVPECLSAGKSGSADLDTRPGEPARSTLKQQVICCYSCAYCSDDIEHIEPELIPVVLSKEYLDIFSAVGYSAQASYFRCKALLDTKRQDYNKAFWASMKAAWTCDDQGDEREARFCRLDALRLFKVAKHAGQAMLPDKESESLLYIDILRRAERFDEAEREIQALREKVNNPQNLKIVEFQQQLVQDYDSSVYTVEDAITFEDKNAMYIVSFTEKQFKNLQESKSVKVNVYDDDLDMRAVFLLSCSKTVSHYAYLQALHYPPIAESQFFPNAIDSKEHTVVFSAILPLKKPFKMIDVLPGEAGLKYSGYRKLERVEREHQKIIEKLIPCGSLRDNK